MFLPEDGFIEAETCRTVYDKIQYRVIHKKRSIFSEVIVSVNVWKNNRIIMCLIVNGYRDRAV